MTRASCRRVEVLSSDDLSGYTHCFMADTLYQAYAKKGNPTDPNPTTKGAYVSQVLQSICCHQTLL